MVQKNYYITFICDKQETLFHSLFFLLIRWFTQDTQLAYELLELEDNWIECVFAQKEISPFPLFPPLSYSSNSLLQM